MDPLPGCEDHCSVFIFNTLIFLAKKCVEVDPHSRPNMVDVFKQLDENSGRIDDIQRTMSTYCIHVDDFTHSCNYCDE